MQFPIMIFVLEMGEGGTVIARITQPVLTVVTYMVWQCVKYYINPLSEC
jgi:hypothetical protein